MNNKKIKFNNYEILGTILWSYPQYNIYNSIDFRKIYFRTNQRLSPKIMRKLYYNNLIWLRKI